jgi:hypothetical protein
MLLLAGDLLVPGYWLVSCWGPVYWLEYSWRLGYWLESCWGGLAIGWSIAGSLAIGWSLALGLAIGWSLKHLHQNIPKCFQQRYERLAKTKAGDNKNVRGNKEKSDLQSKNITPTLFPFFQLPSTDTHRDKQ